MEQSSMESLVQQGADSNTSMETSEIKGEPYLSPYSPKEGSNSFDPGFENLCLIGRDVFLQRIKARLTMEGNSLEKPVSVELFKRDEYVDVIYMDGELKSKKRYPLHCAWYGLHTVEPFSRHWKHRDSSCWNRVRCPKTFVWVNEQLRELGVYVADVSDPSKSIGINIRVYPNTYKPRRQKELWHSMNIVPKSCLSTRALEVEEDEMETDNNKKGCF